MNLDADLDAWAGDVTAAEVLGMTSETIRNCKICDKPTKTGCSRCKSVFYCSQDCQVFAFRFFWLLKPFLQVELVCWPDNTTHAVSNSKHTKTTLLDVIRKIILLCIQLYSPYLSIDTQAFSPSPSIYVPGCRLGGSRSYLYRSLETTKSTEKGS